MTGKSGKAPTYRVPLAELVDSSRVPPEDLVEEQADVKPPHGQTYDGDATGMGMPRLGGAPIF